MAVCELTGKGPIVKNLVSHSNIKTKTIVQPNVQYKNLFSKKLGKYFKLKVAVSTLRTLDHTGGFDKFLMTQDESNLSKRALKIRNLLKKNTVNKD